MFYKRAGDQELKGGREEGKAELRPQKEHDYSVPRPRPDKKIKIEEGKIRGSCFCTTNKLLSEQELNSR